MKRIYLFLTMVAAIFMVGCSDDLGPDTPQIVGGEEVLFFSVATQDGIQTKAPGELLVGEDVIKNLTVLLFYSEDAETYPTGKSAGDYAYGERVEWKEGDPALNFIGDIEIKPGVYDVILIANSNKDYKQSKPSLGELNDIVDDVTLQSQTNMLMVSQLYKNIAMTYLKDAAGVDERRTYCYLLQEPITVEQEKFDVLSFRESKNSTLSDVYKDAEGSKPVVLTRLASRIQLESITFDFTENLDDASFRLDSVYLVNLRPSTLLIPDAAGTYEVKPTGEDVKYYRGGPKDFDVIYGMIAPDVVVDDAKVDVVRGKFAEVYGGSTYTIADGDVLKFTGEKMFQRYAFENHTDYYDDPKVGYDTRLVIVGEIILPKGEGANDDVRPLGKSYYHIPIKKAVTTGEDGITDPGFPLVRNYVYSINVKLTSYGDNRPDGSVTIDPDPEDPEKPEVVVPENPDNNAKFDVYITVEPWNVINQYEEEPDPNLPK